MSFKTCCVLNCFVKLGNGIPLHHFPNPDSKLEQFEDWVSNVGGEIRTLDANFVYRNRRVCHKHFDPVFYATKNRLIKNAVPSLDVPGSILNQHNVQAGSLLRSSPVASTRNKSVLFPNAKPVKRSLSDDESLIERMRKSPKTADLSKQDMAPIAKPDPTVSDQEQMGPPSTFAATLDSE